MQSLQTYVGWRRERAPIFSFLSCDLWAGWKRIRIVRSLLVACHRDCTWYSTISFSWFHPKQIIGIQQYLVRPLGIQFMKNAAATSPNTSATSSENGSIASTSYTEPLIPEAILQSAGRSLGDVISDVSKQSNVKHINAISYDKH